MAIQVITKEDYLEANEYGKEHIFLKLLAERDEALRWKDTLTFLAAKYFSSVANEGARIIEPEKTDIELVEAEAKRIYDNANL